MRVRWNILLIVTFHIFVLNEIRCKRWDGNNNSLKIFPGHGAARIRDYPHVVAIVYLERNQSKLLCGGFNIGQAYRRLGVVLTAGSCVNNLASGRIRKENLFVVSNSEYWDCGCTRSQVYGIRSYRLHPDYKEHVLPYIGKYFENDVGILILKDSWKGVYNNMAMKNPISFKVPQNAWEYPSLTVLGWGHTSQANETSKYLRVAKHLIIIPGERCKKMYYKEGFPKHSYCITSTSVKPPGQGPCDYDQGGPVYLHSYESNQSNIDYTVVGIISNAPRCGDPRKPTIVVNTSAYIDFITNWYWVEARIKTGNNINTLQLSGEAQQPPIGKDWKCKTFTLGGKLCCTHHKSQCIGVKQNGLWWWAKKSDGVEDGNSKSMVGKEIIWEERKQGDSRGTVANGAGNWVGGYVGRGVW